MRPQVHVRRPPLWVPWIMGWTQLFDGLVGICGGGFIPLDLTGKFATWAFKTHMARIETGKEENDSRKRKRKLRRRKSRR